MKKIIYLLAIVFAVSFTATVSSCGGDDDSVENSEGGNNDNGGDEPTSEAMSPEQQKIRLESAATAFIEEFDAANFEEVTNLAAYISDVYSDYEYDAIEEWGETCLEGMLDFVRTWNETETGSSWVDHYTYNEYSLLFKIASFKGDFVAKNGRWKRTDANYLSFTVKDENGADCVLKLTASGDTKKVYVGADEDWDWLGSQYDAGKYYYYYDIDIINNYIMLPSTINVTLYRGAEKMLDAVLNTDLAAMDDENFDLSRDKYNINAAFNFNGYSIVLNKMKYAPAGEGTEISYEIKHGNSNLLTFSASSELDVENDGFYGADNNNINISIMDAVQFKGYCSDVHRLATLLDEADQRDDNEAEFKECVRKMNKLIDVGLYYDYKNVKYASVQLEAFAYEDYWDELTYWSCTPVILFEEDGTSYSFEEFFNEKAFRNVIRAFERLIEDYDDIISDSMR